MVAEPLPPTSPQARQALLMQQWSVRVRDAVYTYLPLLLMALLAAATWWLVRLTPLPPSARPDRVSPSTPDYSLQRFELVRYRGDGRLLARIDGQELRHFPADDRLEVDQIRLRATDDEAQMLATADLGVALQEGQRLRLTGHVRLNRTQLISTEPPLLLETEEMELDVETGQAQSKLPTRLTQGRLVLTASGFEFERSSQQVRLLAPVRASFQPTRMAP